MRDQNGALTFAPRLPDALTKLAFTIAMRGRRLGVEITTTSVTYTLQTGEPLLIAHHGQSITVIAGDPITRAITRSSVTPPQPTQPPGRPRSRDTAGSATPRRCPTLGAAAVVDVRGRT